MTTTATGNLCRITVIGPHRRVDLAVPVTTTVATLLPVLLRHTTAGGGRDADNAEGAWVLQRIDSTPFELSGTPETLDWLEGEELYLRPAEDPLPELDFDDLADGVATVVNRRTDRWQPEYRRVLFMVLTVVAMGALVAVLTDRGPALAQVVWGGAMAVVLMVAALLAARIGRDGGLASLFGLGAAGFAAVGALSAVDGAPDRIVLNDDALIAGAVGIVVVAVILMVLQRTVAPAIPPAPLLVVGVTALVVIGVMLLHTGAGMTAQRAAAIGAAVVFIAIVIAPRVAVKFSRLRGPQLPKTGAEMSYDIEPAPSDVVAARTSDADTYLSVAMLSAALVLPVLFRLMMQIPGWVGWTLVLVLSSAVLLRARTFLGVWQRVGLVTAGTVGYIMVITHFSSTLSAGWRYVLLGGLVALLIPLVLAAIRPWPRRLLPVWEYTATFFDVTTGIAVLPLLGQALGLYAWARGLFG